MDRVQEARVTLNRLEQELKPGQVTSQQLQKLIDVYQEYFRVRPDRVNVATEKADKAEPAKTSR